MVAGIESLACSLTMDSSSFAEKLRDSPNTGSHNCKGGPKRAPFAIHVSVGDEILFDEVITRATFTLVTAIGGVGQGSLQN